MRFQILIFCVIFICSAVLTGISSRLARERRQITVTKIAESILPSGNTIVGKGPDGTLFHVSQFSSPDGLVKFNNVNVNGGTSGGFTITNNNGGFMGQNGVSVSNTNLNGLSSNLVNVNSVAGFGVSVKNTNMGGGFTITNNNVG